MIRPGAQETDFREGDGAGDEAVCAGSFDDATAHLELLAVSPGIDFAGCTEGENVICSGDDLGDCVGVKGVDGRRAGGYQ